MALHKIILKPLGIIYTPFKDVSDNVPIQGRMAPKAEGYIKLYKKYLDACKDLDGFSHAIIIYYFHKSKKERLSAKPYMDTETRGIFSSRFPHRPNHLGLTLVEIISIINGVIKIKGADMLNGTPLLDIKPYNPAFDTVNNLDVKTGWMTKYTSGKRKPVISKTGSRDDWLNESH
ncbi:MAG: tRNA (N6-threonylcarbamoyladenosine(37)-N6)-methyltransferase TrmO [Spirochaetota bacterium]